MSKTKVYIAGKITGDDEYYLKFTERAECLEDSFDVVLNPAQLPEGMKPADYMRICLAMIDTADAVIFLPDWNQSEGAKLEHQYCTYIGKPILYLN